MNLDIFELMSSLGTLSSSMFFDISHIKIPLFPDFLEHIGCIDSNDYYVSNSHCFNLRVNKFTREAIVNIYNPSLYGFGNNYKNILIECKYLNRIFVGECIFKFIREDYTTALIIKGKFDINGRKTGEWKVFHNSVVNKYNFQEDVFHGECILYYRNLRNLFIYRHGVLEEYKCFV